MTWNNIFAFSAAASFTLIMSACSFFKKTDDKTEGYSEERKIMESRAQVQLQRARTWLAQGDFERAKGEIEAMRKKNYLAIDARNKGILLMDSISLMEARAELNRTDSLQRCGKVSAAQLEDACQKVQFYERKLQFDGKREGGEE